MKSNCAHDVLLKSIRFQDRLAWTHKKNLESSAQGCQYDLIDSDLSFYRRKGIDHFGPHFFIGCLFATWHAPHLLPNTTPTSALWHHIFQHPLLGANTATTRCQVYISSLYLPFPLCPSTLTYCCFGIHLECIISLRG